MTHESNRDDRYRGQQTDLRFWHDYGVADDSPDVAMPDQQGLIDPIGQLEFDPLQVEGDYARVVDVVDEVVAHVQRVAEVVCGNDAFWLENGFRESAACGRPIEAEAGSVRRGDLPELRIIRGEHARHDGLGQQSVRGGKDANELECQILGRRGRGAGRARLVAAAERERFGVSDAGERQDGQGQKCAAAHSVVSGKAADAHEKGLPCWGACSLNAALARVNHLVYPFAPRRRVLSRAAAALSIIFAHSGSASAAVTHFWIRDGNDQGELPLCPSIAKGEFQ